MEQYFDLIYNGPPFILFGRAHLTRTRHHHPLLFFLFILPQNMGRKGKEHRPLGLCHCHRGQ